MTKEYFNTTDVVGDELERYKIKASSQTAKVYALFKAMGDEPMTPSECFGMMDGHAPITSIRRAISVLTKHGLLQKTKIKSVGMYGRPELNWVFNND